MYNKQYIKNAFLVDSTGFALKYWFSMPPVKTKNFESIAAFLGFASFVIRLLKNYQPKYISFQFDESLGTCFRNELYPDYKKTRESAPDELKNQLELCRKFLTLMGLDNNASKKYEADDILNTIAQNTRKGGLKNIILTNDKDLYQIIYKGDVWWDFKDKKYGYKDLVDKLNFSPQDLSDFLALMGDSVDNIPGAPGLGEKTAMVLMGKYKSLKKIVQNLETIPEELGSKYKRFVKIIKDNQKIIYLSKKLATLEYITDLNKDIAAIERKVLDINGLEALFLETGMKEGQKESWLRDIKKLFIS